MAAASAPPITAMPACPRVLLEPGADGSVWATCEVQPAVLVRSAVTGEVALAGNLPNGVYAIELSAGPAPQCLLADTQQFGRRLDGEEIRISCARSHTRKLRAGAPIRHLQEML
jgi:hypothetical protein